MNEASTGQRTDQLEREIRESWSVFPSPTDLATMPLTPVTGMPKAGSRPQLTLVDRRGARYFFKIAPRDQIAAELFAGRILALGQRLHVPAVRRELRLAGVPTGFGLLQPIVDVCGALDVDPGKWSAEQTESLLRLHPWEWLAANLDTHVDQYVLVGRGKIPVNIDWDHSLLDLAKSDLSRFNRRSLAVVPVRNLLYADFIAGRRPLQLDGLLREAARVAAIPFEAIESATAIWANESGAGPALRDQTIAHMAARHARLLGDFQRFVESLEAERAGREGRRFSPRQVAPRAADVWQRFAVSVLHTSIVRPTLGAYRRWLRSFAGRRRAS
jgi:hypothetical protein